MLKSIANHIFNMLNQIEFLYSKFLQSHGVSTDTRTIQPENLFFGLNGPNFKGSDFAMEALKKGASFAVIDDPDFQKHPQVIVVKNTLKALQELATFHRSRFKRKVIALTGSNGKTTTKELLKSVLSKKYIVHATEGNYNNHIGVPLTLLHIHPQVEIAIIEMGANRQGDINELCEYAMPTHGLITNIGQAHTETFGGIAGVLKGKTELFNYLSKTGGTIFWNDQDLHLAKIADRFNQVSHYPDSDVSTSGSIPHMDFFVKGKKYESHLTGKYNFLNVAAAIHVGRHFEVPDFEIADAIASYVPQNHRSQIIEKSGKKIIMDAYNANPDSMKAAIENLALYPGRKAAILGDMNELEHPLESHQEIIQALELNQIQQAVLIGKYFWHVKKTIAGFTFFQNKEEALDQIKETYAKSDAVLIKSSRSSKLESLLNLFN